jgi:hypothetical protein
MKNSFFIVLIVLIITGMVMVFGNKKNVTTNTNPGPTVTVKITQKETPLPREDDIIRIFFNLIDEKRPTEAVAMMNETENSQKQAWAVQFNAIRSIKVLSVEPSMQNEWTDTKHSYKVVVDVTMKPESASAPIPYYNWDNGQNIRWINLEKSGNGWKIAEIATGP